MYEASQTKDGLVRSWQRVKVSQGQLAGWLAGRLGSVDTVASRPASHKGPD